MTPSARSWRPPIPMAPLIITTRALAAAVPSGARFVRAARVTPDPSGLLIEVHSSWGARGAGRCVWSGNSTSTTR